MERNVCLDAKSPGGAAGSIPGSSTNAQGGGPLDCRKLGELVEPDAQADWPRLPGELEVAMYEGDRYAAFTHGCSHAFH
jgi:hypothetical protein